MSEHLSHLEFQGLIGRGLASGQYASLFAKDGRPKSIVELQMTPVVAQLLPEPHRVPPPERGLRAKRTGVTRFVILLGRYAFMQEADFGRTGWEELVPVVFALPGGWLIVQRRCEPIPDAVWEAFDPVAFCEREDRHIPAEHKQDSFGLLDGRIVALDYGS